MYARIYHKVIRTSLVIVALLLVFDSGMVHPMTKQLSTETVVLFGNAIGGSGVYVSVEPTELNTITAELTARERELDEREAALRDAEGRSIPAREFGGGGSADYSTYLLSVILFVLTVLILLNYAMDFTRFRKFQS